MNKWLKTKEREREREQLWKGGSRFRWVCYSTCTAIHLILSSLLIHMPHSPPGPPIQTIVATAAAGSTTWMAKCDHRCLQNLKAYWTEGFHWFCTSADHSSSNLFNRHFFSLNTQGVMLHLQWFLCNNKFSNISTKLIIMQVSWVLFSLVLLNGYILSSLSPLSQDWGF